MHQSKKRMDIPSPSEKPEIKPSEEPPVKIWPIKTPEVIPARVPERQNTPAESPAPPESKTS